MNFQTSQPSIQGMPRIERVIVAKYPPNTWVVQQSMVGSQTQYNTSGTSNRFGSQQNNYANSWQSGKWGSNNQQFGSNTQQQGKQFGFGNNGTTGFQQPAQFGGQQVTDEQRWYNEVVQPQLQMTQLISQRQLTSTKINSILSETEKQSEKLYEQQAQQKAKQQNQFGSGFGQFGSNNFTQSGNTQGFSFGNSFGSQQTGFGASSTANASQLGTQIPAKSPFSSLKTQVSMNQKAQKYNKVDINLQLKPGTMLETNDQQQLQSSEYNETNESQNFLLIQMNKQGPISGRYRLEPSAEMLWTQSDEQLRAVPDFSVLCGEQYVKFLEPVDVRNLDCERAFLFENGVVRFSSDPKITGKRVLVGIKCSCPDSQKAQQWCASCGAEFYAFDGKLLEFITTVP